MTFTFINTHIDTYIDTVSYPLIRRAMGCSSSVPDRSAGRLGGVNPENGGANDPKNLRVKGLEKPPQRPKQHNTFTTSSPTLQLKLSMRSFRERERERERVQKRNWINFIDSSVIAQSYNREAYADLMRFLESHPLNDGDKFCADLMRESSRHKSLGCPQTWRGFSALAFKDLWPIFKLSLSAGAMLCLEVWYYPVLVLLTGNMKNAEVAIDALSICININGWEMMISLGFMAAASVRIANELGAGNSKASKFSIATIVTTSFTIGFVLFVLFLIFRGSVAYLFTENRDVVSSVDQMSTLLAFSILLNSVQPVLSGAL